MQQYIRPLSWSKIYIFTLYIAILLAQVQNTNGTNKNKTSNNSSTSNDYLNSNEIDSDGAEDLSDEDGYQICGVENNAMALDNAISKTDIIKELIKESNVHYSVITHSEMYLDRKTQRLAIRHALDIVSEIINVDFIEVANTFDVVIQFRYGFNMTEHGYKKDVIAYCEKEKNQSAPGTNSDVQILFDIDTKWAYLDAEKILMKTTKQKWSRHLRKYIYPSKYVYVDFLYTALHELSHVLGLDHNYGKNSLMRKKYRPILDTHGNYIVPRISDHEIIQLRDNFATRANNFSCVRAGLCRDLHAEKREEEESEPKFTEDYLRASIEYKVITEDKLSNIIKWATDGFKQNAKSELMCREIINKLDNKYGYDWNCFYDKINDRWYRHTDSYVVFKFKEMDNKRLLIYRSQGQTFIQFNQTQIRNSISQTYTNMDQYKQDNAVKWLEEALNKFTDDNGKERKGYEICTVMRNNFQSEYGYNWICIHSAEPLLSLIANDYGFQERIWFYINKQFNIGIFRTDEYCFNYSLNNVKIVESTLTKGEEENATTTLYNVLNIIKYYTHRTSIGKFDKICDDMVNQFNKTYGGDWQCLLTTIFNDRGKYLSRKPDKFIEFRLKDDDIRIVLFDISSINNENAIIKKKLASMNLFVFTLFYYTGFRGIRRLDLRDDILKVRLPAALGKLRESRLFIASVNCVNMEWNADSIKTKNCVTLCNQANCSGSCRNYNSNNEDFDKDIYYVNSYKSC